MPRISIWNDKILLHINKEDLPPPILPYAKWIEKRRYYMLWFGVQNLKRLYNIFSQMNDPVIVSSGQERIDRLKLKLSEITAMGKLAQQIKTTNDLPHIDYKVEPLGLYQHRGVVFLTKMKSAPLFADCGCLDGDTEIRINRAGISRKKTLKQLYESMYCAGGPGREWDPSIQTRVRAFNGSFIGLHPIKDVKRQGIKDVYRLTLEDGKSILATEDHEFLTDRPDFVRLDQLSISDSVMVDNLVEHYGVPEYSKVKSIVPAGKRVTYDIVCEDPHRNFAANGIIVHNCGKTFVDLVASENLIKSGEIDRGKILVCGKLTTLETGWMEDVKKFTNLTAVLVWLGSPYKRKEKMLELLNTPADIYITNHETVIGMQDELIKKAFQKVVVDESTILKSYHGDFKKSGGKFGQALLKVAHNASWRVVMSGTPAPNGPEDLWGQYKFLDPEGILMEPSFDDFQNTYMKKMFFGNKRYQNEDYGEDPIIAEIPEKLQREPFKWIMKKGAAETIQNFVMPFAYRVKIRDHLVDLPPRTIIKRTVKMSAEQQKHYLEMREALATFLDNELIAISNRLAQLTKLRQITGGFLIDQTEETHQIESATKLEALDDLMEEIGNQRIVIFAQYRWEIKTLAERYKERNVVTVYGDNLTSLNLENINNFIKDPSIGVIIMHPKSCAYGITLTVSHYMIFYSISHSELENYQCIKRIERAGQKEPMFIYYLIATFYKPMDGTNQKKIMTIDEAIYEALQLKAKNQEELLDQSNIDKDILKNL